MTAPIRLNDLQRAEVEQIIDETIAGRKILASRYARREDALLWAMKLHENRGSVTTDTIIKAAKAFEDYVYGEES